MHNVIIKICYSNFQLYIENNKASTKKKHRRFNLLSILRQTQHDIFEPVSPQMSKRFDIRPCCSVSTLKVTAEINRQATYQQKEENDLVSLYFNSVEKLGKGAYLLYETKPLVQLSWKSAKAKGRD